MAINKNVLLAGGGMALLLTGKKVAALSMFTRGALGLERQWRDKHPDVAPTFQARWGEAIRFYEETHQNERNRLLHRIGIPMIVGGAAALLLSKPLRPLWTLGALSFTAGWTLNIVGHTRHEKNAPAFADDPLSFIAGPVWDWQQLRSKKKKQTVPSSVASAVLN